MWRGVVCVCVLQTKFFADGKNEAYCLCSELLFQLRIFTLCDGLCKLLLFEYPSDGLHFFSLEFVSLLCCLFVARSASLSYETKSKVFLFNLFCLSVHFFVLVQQAFFYVFLRKRGFLTPFLS